MSNDTIESSAPAFEAEKQKAKRQVHQESQASEESEAGKEGTQA